MTINLQVHGLTCYAISNPNRDEDGNNKTATVGGFPRIRISSQSLKRAYRIGSAFAGLADNLGERTKKLPEWIYDQLVGEGVGEKEAAKAAVEIVKTFSDMVKADPKGKDHVAVHGLATSTLVFVGPHEKAAMLEVAREIVAGAIDAKGMKAIPQRVLGVAQGAADISLFGRMLAGTPQYNVEAAAQVGHAITTHAAIADYDYFTAVDDRKAWEESGAAHLDHTRFASGVYYQPSNVNLDLLVKNLKGDVELAKKTAVAFVESVASESPAGKRATFGHNPRASYLMLELVRGNPRDLTAAFHDEPVKEKYLANSIAALEKQVSNFDRVYGQHAEARIVLNVSDENSATMEDVREFVRKAFSKIEVEADA